MTTLLTSSETALRLGVGVSAVKRWAEQGMLACVKTAGGHRRFPSTEIERFQASRRSDAHGDTWAPWFDAMLGPGNTYAVMALLCGARAQDGSWHAAMSRVGDVLRRVGERWADGNLNVAQEHVASAALARALAMIADTLPLPHGAPRCLLASAEGDLHTLGLSMAEVSLRELGWASLWLGAPTGTEHVIERVRSREVQMVALSASESSSNRRALAKQARLVGDACRRAGIPLVLGGRGAWPDAPAFGDRLDHWSRLQQVVRDPRQAPSRREEQV